MDEQSKIRTDLILAVKKGELETVKDVLSFVDLTYSRLRSEEYFLLDMLYSLIHYAVENKHTNVAILLFLYGYKVKRDERWITPLQFAVMNGEIEIVNMLLNGGAQIDAIGLFGTTALQLAAEYKIIDSIKLLLRRGANVDATNKHGETALHIASERGNTEIVENLLNHRANINCAYTSPTFREGYTPLHFAVNKNKEEVIKLLLSRGANINAEGEYGTALHIACEGKKIEIVEHLLNHGADINCIYTSDFRKGYTPLHLAVEQQCEEIIKLLLRRGANVDAKDKDGKTALHIASDIANIKIVERLLNHGADINCAYTSTKFREGCTPLHLAVATNSEQITKLLLNNGANMYIKAKGIGGRTALQIAYDNWFIGSLYRFTKIFEHHQIRMETAYLYKSNKNISIKSNDESDKDFRNKCEKQIAILRSEKFNNTNVSFYDILAKGHNINQLAIYARNENLVQVLRSKDYEIKFPIYASMINSNFIKGERRRELLEESNNIFHLFFNNFGLPTECTEKIFSYLSCADLRILIDTY